MSKTEIFALTAQLLPLLGAGFGFIYGMIRFFKKGVALYLQIIVCALGCMMLGRLFVTVSLLTTGEIPNIFHIGYLGTFGCFMFLFSANYGQMDGLVDGREKEYRKYRLLPLFMPLAIAVFAAAMMFSDCGLQSKIITLLAYIPITLASYYHMKHCIMPDIEMGILKSIRPFNLCALAFCLVSALELLFVAFDAVYAQYVTSVILTALSVALIPVLEKGAKKWEM